MSHIITPNFSLSGTTNATDAIWALTRAMQKAGWVVLASSFGNTLNQKYITGRYHDSISSGASGAISTAPDTQRLTITGLTGMVSKHCGYWLEITGAVNGANNGAFIITEVNSATSVNIFNPSRVTPDAGTISWTLRPFVIEPGDFIWSLGATLAGPTSGASLAAGSTPDRMQITGMSGLTNYNVGDYVTVTGASTSANNGTWYIARVLSASSCEVLARANASPYTGTITWTLKTGTGSSQGTGSAASISTKVISSDYDYLVTGISHTAYNSGASGAVGAITSYPNYNLMQVNNLSGCSTSDIGSWLLISGATDSGNNGEFLVVSYVSASSLIVLNSNRVPSGTGTLTWSLRKGPQEGNFLSIEGASSTRNNGTFQIVKTISATSCHIRNYNGTASDANNGAISWNHRDPTKQTVSAALTAGWDRGSWVVLQGISVIKMPLSGGVYDASSFVRNEKVTQASTSAEGELLGITYDNTGAGWAIIMTQVVGSGTDYDDGWALSEIVGSTSGCKFVPTGVQKYEREVMFAAAANAADWYRGGYAAQTYLRKDTEQRNRLWLRAFNSSCTAILYPGGSSTTDTDGNTFPTRAFAWIGAIASAYWYYWTCTNQNPDTVAHNKAQIVAANAIRRQGVSPDGTFWLNQYISGAAFYGHIGFVRLDDTEEGEVDPWAFFSPSFSSSPFTPTRTGSASGIGDTVSKWQYLVQYVASQRAFMTTRGLGVSGIDATCVGVNGAYLSTFMTDNATSAWTTSSQTTSLNGQTYLHTIKSAQGTKRHMEKIWLVHNDPSTNRFIKGTIRWWFISTWAGSGAYSTFGGRSIVQLSAGGTNHFTMPIFAGPWDGFTDPVAT